MSAKKNKPAKPTLRVVAHNAGNLADIDSDYTALVRAFVNARVREYVAGRGNISRLARKAGITSATVSRLAYYETTHPRWHTVMSVITALECMHEFAELTMRYADRHG